MTKDRNGHFCTHTDAFTKNITLVQRPYVFSQKPVICLYYKIYQASIHTWICKEIDAYEDGSCRNKGNHSQVL